MPQPAPSLSPCTLSRAMLTSPSALAVTVPASAGWHCRRVRLWHSPLLVTSSRSPGNTGWPFSCQVTATSSGDTRHLKVASSPSSTVRLFSSVMISTTLGTTAGASEHGTRDPLSCRAAEHPCTSHHHHDQLSHCTHGTGVPGVIAKRRSRLTLHCQRCQRPVIVGLAAVLAGILRLHAAQDQ